MELSTDDGMVHKFAMKMLLERRYSQIPGLNHSFNYFFPNIIGGFSSYKLDLVRFSHLNVPFFHNSDFYWNIVLVGKQ